jgi:hypothetical protein
VRLGKAGKPLRVAVVGCGGAGRNSLRFVSGGLDIDVLALGADARRALGAGASKNIHAPEHELDGAAYTDSRIDISGRIRTASLLANELRESDAVFPVCGLGGRSGWKCALMASRVAREAGALSIAIAILPFSVEASSRRADAIEQAAVLRRHCDGLIILHNDRITGIAPRLPFKRAMEVVSELALLLPHEIAASGTEGDATVLRQIFSPGTYAVADVLSVDGVDFLAGAAKAALASEWMAPESGRVVSLLLMADNCLADDVEGISATLKRAFPALELAGVGESGAGMPSNDRKRAFVALVMRGNVR